MRCTFLYALEEGIIIGISRTSLFIRMMFEYLFTIYKTDVSSFIGMLAGARTSNANLIQSGIDPEL